ncbi:hypothetical protein TNCV_649671 [Trichonephila clavipes]|nr:hypothetical protein TNCV_649671 [Trichonephila clavipes]
MWSDCEIFMLGSRKILIGRANRSEKFHDLGSVRDQVNGCRALVGGSGFVSFDHCSEATFVINVMDLSVKSIAINESVAFSDSMSSVTDVVHHGCPLYYNRTCGSNFPVVDLCLVISETLIAQST